MRVAHLSTMRGFYGGEVCLHSLATGLCGRGHQVGCAVRPDSALAAELAGSGVQVAPMALVDWFDPGTIRRLRRWLIDGRYEILHAHLPRDYYIAATASAGLPVRLVGTRHHLAPISAAPLKRPFLRRFRRLIAVSDAVRRSLDRSRVIDPGRLVTIPNGVDPAPADAPDDARRLRAELAVAPGAPLVGYVGRLSRQKGIGTLLEAFVALAGAHPEAHLALVGDAGRDGEFTVALRGRIADAGLTGRVHLCGYRRRAERLGAAFDIQVVPSLAEPFGLVTLEALAHGTAVVATRSGGSPEILRDGRDGLLVAPDDAGELADALSRLLEDRGLRERLGGQGRRRVLQDFTRATMLERTERLYAAVLAEAAAADAVAFSPAFPARPAAGRRSSAARR